MPASGSEPEPLAEAIARFVFAIGDGTASVEAFDALAAAHYPDATPEDRVFWFGTHHQRYSPIGIDGKLLNCSTSSVMLWLAQALLDAGRRSECKVAVGQAQQKSLPGGLQPSEERALDKIQRALGTTREHAAPSTQPRRAGRRRPQLSLEEAMSALGNPDLRPNTALLAWPARHDGYGFLFARTESGLPRFALVPPKVYLFLKVLFLRGRGQCGARVEESEVMDALRFKRPEPIKQLQHRASRILGELEVGKISRRFGVVALDARLMLDVHTDNTV